MVALKNGDSLLPHVVVASPEEQKLYDILAQVITEIRLETFQVFKEDIDIIRENSKKQEPPETTERFFQETVQGIARRDLKALLNCFKKSADSSVLEEEFMTS